MASKKRARQSRALQGASRSPIGEEIFKAHGSMGFEPPLRGQEVSRFGIEKEPNGAMAARHRDRGEKDHVRAVCRGSVAFSGVAAEEVTGAGAVASDPSRGSHPDQHRVATRGAVHRKSRRVSHRIVSRDAGSRPTGQRDSAHQRLDAKAVQKRITRACKAALRSCTVSRPRDNDRFSCWLASPPSS